LQCFLLTSTTVLHFLSCDGFERNEPVLVKVLARRIDEPDLLGVVAAAARMAGFREVFGDEEAGDDGGG
jgi:hypothetical protein